VTRKRRGNCSESECSLPAKGKGLCNRHYLRLYRTQNLERSREQARRYAETHREERQEYKRVYRAENRDKIRADMAAYRKRHRDRVHAGRMKRDRRLKENGVFLVTEADIRKLRRRPCYICGLPADTIDHRVPIAKGGRHSVGNLESCCRACNFSKRDALLVQFRRKRRSPAA